MRVPVITLSRIVFLLALAAVGGCASQATPPVPFVHPEVLYLQDKPCARLYVEVDRMEGVKLPEHWADELKAFLEKYCLKPDGVDVVLDAPLPIDEYQGFPIGLASVLCIDGPPANDRPPPAYVHLFVYDGRTTFQGSMRNPRVVRLCSTGIFMNVDYARYSPEAVAIHMLRHECGHVLGLSQNTAHGDGAHCRKPGCLMHPVPDWLSQLGGTVHLYFREHALCADCERDLSVCRAGPAEESLSFAGPFLVRQTGGYCVASLPFCDILIASPTPSVFNWREALTQTKAGIRASAASNSGERRISKDDHWTCWTTFYARSEVNASPEVRAENVAILTKALNDPSPFVKQIAATGLKEREEAAQSQKQ